MRSSNRDTLPSLFPVSRRTRLSHSHILDGIRAGDMNQTRRIVMQFFPPIGRMFVCDMKALLNPPCIVHISGKRED